jgi:hypothetical protein
MDNSETTIAAEPDEQSAAPEAAASAPEAAPAVSALIEPASVEQPKPKGRPQGSKDRQPRTRRPTIRVESLPTPEPVAEPAKPSRVQPRAAPTPAATPPEPLEEPPSPQTLYRETSERLVRLRRLLNESKRAAAADKYTSRLSLWAV